MARPSNVPQRGLGEDNKTGLMNLTRQALADMLRDNVSACLIPDGLSNQSDVVSSKARVSTARANNHVIGSLLTHKGASHRIATKQYLHGPYVGV